MPDPNRYRLLVYAPAAVNIPDTKRPNILSQNSDLLISLRFAPSRTLRTGLVIGLIRYRRSNRLYMD